jgi:hypothetical protein
LETFSNTKRALDQLALGLPQFGALPLRIDRHSLTPPFWFPPSPRLHQTVSPPSRVVVGASPPRGRRPPLPPVRCALLPLAGCDGRPSSSSRPERPPPPRGLRRTPLLFILSIAVSSSRVVPAPLLIITGRSGRPSFPPVRRPSSSCTRPTSHLLPHIRRHRKRQGHEAAPVFHGRPDEHWQVIEFQFHFCMHPNNRF